MIFHHIGIACTSIDETASYISSQFDIIQKSNKVYDSRQDAYLQMIQLADGTKLELVSGDAVAVYVKKKNYLYHTCYVVENIEQTILVMQEKGDFLVREPREAILFGGHKVAFLMTPLGLIELLEETGHD